MNSEQIDLLFFEKEKYKQGYKFVAGIDEVGRGPLAGPVVAAAVILPNNPDLEGVNDSKKLTAKKRELFYEMIKKQALAIGVGIATVEEIDDINILQATKLAMKRALADLSITPDYLLIDHLTIDDPLPQLGITKGDAKSLTIAAASIVAKVVRDKIMVEIGIQHQGYGFEKNSGYGTKAHLDGVKKLGYIEGVHRRSFQPIKSMLQESAQLSLF